jgi:hypothetical protein
MFSFGLTCAFNGDEVPMFVTYSNNCSITSHLLTSILSKMDDLELFERSDGVDPFLLCDGQGSRFEDTSLSIPWDRTDHDHGVLMCHMVHPCDKLEIAQSKMEHSK